MFNILVIDGDTVLRDSLSYCLEKLGCDVSTADTAETAFYGWNLNTETGCSAVKSFFYLF